MLTVYADYFAMEGMKKMAASMKLKTIFNLIMTAQTCWCPVSLKNEVSKLVISLLFLFIYLFIFYLFIYLFFYLFIY